MSLWSFIVLVDCLFSSLDVLIYWFSVTKYHTGSKDFDEWIDHMTIGIKGELWSMASDLEALKDRGT